MKKKYETMVIFDGSLSDDAIEKEHKKVEEFLSKNTEFEKTEVWGKKSLAYEINKKKTGNYYLYLYRAEGNVADLMNKRFKLNKAILRHITVLFEEAPDLKNRAIKQQPVEEEVEK